MPETVIAPAAHPYPDDERFPSGWFSWEECDLLADWARGKLVLELGVYLGRSTVAMARTAKHVVSVDHFQGSPLENWYKPADSLVRCRENLLRYGVGRSVTLIAGDHSDLQRFGLFAHREFDGVLVDGAHDAASVARDSAIAMRATSPKAVVWDDYIANWPDVMAYVNALGQAVRLAVTPLAPGSKLVRLA
jgi:predicted O-methyltransferase YrrM